MHPLQPRAAQLNQTRTLTPKTRMPCRSGNNVSGSNVFGSKVGFAPLLPLLPETASLSAEQQDDEVDETQELDAAFSPVDEAPVDEAPIASLKPDLEPSAPTEPLLSEAPTQAELQALLQGWLDAKALMLSGEPADLSVVAREPLVKRVELEREADQAAGRSKSIDASITSIEVVDRKPQRIELLAQVAYSDRLQAADGTVIDETAPTDFSVTYVLGRDGTQWRLHDYIPGS